MARPSGRKIVHVWEPKWGRGHMVLVRPGDDQRVKKIVQELKWSRSSPSVVVLESKDGNKGTLHPNTVRQRKMSLIAHFLKLFRWLLSHLHRYIWSSALSTYMLVHMFTTDTCIYLHISGYSSAWGILLHLHIPSNLVTVRSWKLNSELDYELE